ncbi:MAG: NAD(P)-binding domain-containing protein [Woeseiaceae bacterium]|nr:NAD(P)-binding domain-containing protein [Woeseiaceae bacterium]NIP19754.1 NAD(P)-binding domain-containing protein [Woeseiaceae bacterium]NIS89871.1 NAD(P)-binding domain-containing protein [Woeseiaceae bacterium]
MSDKIIETDALIVGAGPVGIFQVFELGLLGVKAHILDTMRVAGGQCAELYPDKPIYDIPGIPVCSAEELIDALMEQIKPFDAEFHLGEEVTEVEVLDDDWFRVVTDSGTEFRTKTVFIAGGVGSFQPRRLRFEGIDTFEDKNLFYKVRDPGKFDGKNVVILGGGDSALDWVVELAPKCEKITSIHRRPEYRGAQATVDKMLALADAGKVEPIIGQVSGYKSDDNGVTAIRVEVDGEEREIPCDAVLVFYGLAPKLGPIAQWGLDINRKTINVDTEKFETSTPGIYAVGDINFYPGKKKLILSGFHEAALAAFAAKARIEPEKKVRLQYTTTSPLMHERLGIKDE